MGGKQLGFSGYDQTTAKKQTEREKFLSEMEEVVPSDALIALIELILRQARREGVLPTRWRPCCGSTCSNSGNP
jgi:IS5 family transposase